MGGGASLSIGVTENRGVSLCEALDRVLDTGVVGHGDIVITVADVDLVFLSLRLLLSSVDTARAAGAAMPESTRSIERPGDAPASRPVAPARRPDTEPAAFRAASSAPVAPQPPGLAPAVAPSPVESLAGAAPTPRVELLPRDEALPAGTTRLNIPRDDVKNGLAQLVMVLVKLLHELMERQAVRRIDGGTLSDEEIDRLGTTLMRQAEEIRRLQKTLGLSDSDMNLDLGPLGKLL